MLSAAHLPEIILGDRGELEGYNVNHLIEGLNITIENNPSFRPDWKGIVENYLIHLKKKYGHFTWVCFKRLGKRGTKDPRLGAKLDIEQYTKLLSILFCITIKTSI